MKRKKLLFVGNFNYSRESIVKFAWAYSGRQAKVFMMQQLAGDHGVKFKTVAKRFDGSKPNFSIEVDEKWKEKQNAKMQELR